LFLLERNINCLLSKQAAISKLSNGTESCKSVVQVEVRGAWESVLMVTHAASGARRWVHLHGGWRDAEVRSGDPVNVIVVNPVHDWSLASDGELHITVSQDGAVLLVMHPDLLISSTSIASALECPREAMLKERGYGGPSRAALVGTMMHDVVQSAIQALTEGGINEPPTAVPHRPAPFKRDSVLLPPYVHDLDEL
jgi:DNA replication factor Dna2